MSASRKKIERSLRRWGLILLAAALLCTFWPGNSYRAYAADTDGAIAYLYHKDAPLVEVRGNIVEDNGVPTGFYELALCVQTKYYAPLTGEEKPISQEAYDKLGEAEKAGYTVHNASNFSFQSVAASLKINTDVLTPVRWDAAYPEYASWDGDAGMYNMNEYGAAGRTTHFARGLDLTKADITNIRGADYHSQVRLDTAKPDEVNAATALVEHYADETDETAILTLSATAPTAGVVYDEMTPVVVVRFAYDKARFADAKNEFGVWEKEDSTGSGASFDTLVTWLSADEEAAKSSVNQSVWFQAGLEANEDPTALPPDYTMFYYYQGANYGELMPDETDPRKDKEIDVNIKMNGGGVYKAKLNYPDTAGRAVLTEDTLQKNMNNKYSYMNNRLRTAWVSGEPKTLYFERVHQETYRKPTGGTGGTQILFYDWDDTLIGAMIVDKGDVRAEVNDYVESHMVHPQIQSQLATLRSALGGDLKNIDDPTKAEASRKPLLEEYKKHLDSIDRVDTYRGQYSSDPAVTDADIDINGAKYPLTNKLDYAFYRRVNTVTTASDGTKYYTAQSVSADESSALYPYVYGWAIVEDEDVKTAEDWYLRRDSVKTEDIWTTFGVGELSNVTAEYNRPAVGADANANEMPDTAKMGSVTYPGGLAKVPACAAAESTASLLSVGAAERVEAPLEADVLTPEIPLGEEAVLAEEPALETLPGDAVRSEDAALTAEDVPVELLADTPTPAVKAPDHYYFHTSDKDGNSYLKFADFSNVDAMLSIPGSTEKKSVLVVKAVYEQGTSLRPNDSYRVVDDSLNIERYSTAASAGNATYSFQYQYERANVVNGALVGVGRIREPGVQTGMTFDAMKLGQKNDPNEVFYIQNITTNTDIMDVDLTASGAIWRLSYILVDKFDLNIATGVVRSAGKELKLADNFAYTDEMPYSDRQGTNGFILQATLSTLLKEATAAAKGEDNSLSAHFGYDTVQDLNLRKNEDGDEFANLSNWTECATYLKDLVTKMYEHRDAHSEYFDKNGNAVLTWHQLQREIIMRNANQGSILGSDGKLMSNENCAGFTWCRLCTEDTDVCKNKEIVILTYGDMFKAIAVKTSQPDKYNDAIARWKTDGASTFDFRKDEEGIPYYMGTPEAQDAFLGLMEMAYGKLVDAEIAEPWKASWKVVQEILIKGAYNATPTFNYWWGPEGTPPAIESWDDLLKRAIQEYIGVDVDGNGTLETKLTNAFDGFDGTDLRTLVSVHKAGEPTNLGWFRTGNIDPADDEHAIEFTAEEFKTALEKALTALINDGHYAATVDGIKSASWEEIQYALIAATGKYPGEPAYKNLTQINAGYDYWWKNGGKPKLTYEKFRPTLMDHVNKWPNPTEASALITSISVVTDQLRFRADEYGGEFTTEKQFLDTLRDALVAAYGTSNRSDYVSEDGTQFTLSWEQLQWFLIHHGEVGGGALPGAETFWWKEATGTPPNEPIRVTTISALLQGAKWTWAPSALNDQALQGDSLVSEITALHLRKENGVPYTDKTEFLTDMEAAYTALVNGLSANKVTTATWAEVQYALIHGTFKSEAAIRADAAVDFWWENGGTPAITDLASLMKAAWYYDKGATDALTQLPDVEAINNSKEPLYRLRKDNDAGIWGESQLSTLKETLANAAKALTTSPGPYTLENIGTATWEEVQYAFINNGYKSAADIEAEKIDYWWKDKDVKPGGGIVERQIADWDEFMGHVSGYLCGKLSNKNALKDYLDPARNDANMVKKLTDTYYLRIGETDADKMNEYGDFTARLNSIRDKLMKPGYLGSRYNEAATDVTKKVYMSWWEFQYALIHADDENRDWAAEETKFPAETDLDKSVLYPWKIQPPPTEKQIADWDTFMGHVSGYLCGKLSNKNALKDYLDPARNDANMVKKLTDTYYLRIGETDADKMNEYGDFTARLNSIRDKLMKPGHLGSRYNAAETDVTKKVYMTWWEFQYALIHANDTDWATKTFPSEQDIKDKLEENNYTWKFVDGYSGVTPNTTSKALSAPPPQQAVMWLPEAVSDCITKLRAGMAAVAA